MAKRAWPVGFALLAAGAFALGVEISDLDLPTSVRDLPISDRDLPTSDRSLPTSEPADGYELRIEYPAEMSQENAPWADNAEALNPGPDRVIYLLSRAGQTAFLPNGRVEIRAAAEAAKFLDEETFRQVSEEVDFRRQYVLMLAWDGSGRDEIRAAYDEADPREVVFEITEGATMDFHRHLRVYVIRSGIRWRFAK